MLTAVHGSNGGVNLAHMVSWRRVGEDVHLEMVNGETKIMSAGGFEVDVENSVAGVIPAQPGTRHLQDITERGKVVEILDVTLLAFIVRLDGIVIYLTVDGPEEDGAVLFPDGTVERFHQGKWRDLRAYTDAMVEKAG